jgi:hypothetical protein
MIVNGLTSSFGKRLHQVFGGMYKGNRNDIGLKGSLYDKSEMAYIPL